MAESHLRFGAYPRQLRLFSYHAELRVLRVELVEPIDAHIELPNAFLLEDLE